MKIYSYELYINNIYRHLYINNIYRHLYINDMLFVFYSLQGVPRCVCSLFPRYTAIQWDGLSQFLLDHTFMVQNLYANTINTDKT